MKHAACYGLMLFVGSAALAEEITLTGTSITFEAPEGFTPLSDDEIKTKFPSSRAPKFVLGNDRRTTTIAYDLKPNKIREDELNEVKATFEQLFKRLIPGLVWKKRDIIEVSGRKCIYFEMTSSAIDTDIYNIMLATPYKDQMLVFNFNSTKEEFPKVEKTLRKSLKSISIK